MKLTDLMSREAIEDVERKTTSQYLLEDRFRKLKQAMTESLDSIEHLFEEQAEKKETAEAGVESEHELRELMAACIIDFFRTEDKQKLVTALRVFMIDLTDAEEKAIMSPYNDYDLSDVAQEIIDNPDKKPEFEGG